MVDWLTPVGMTEDAPILAPPPADPLRTAPMVLEAGASWARLTQATAEQRQWLAEYTGFERVVYMGGERTSTWFYTLTAAGNLPSGLVGLVERAATMEKIPLRVVWDAKTAVPDRAADLAWLRPDQRAGVWALSDQGRGIIEAPTGAGKTEVAIALTLCFPTVEWLFVVHRADLVSQTAARYNRRTGERAGSFERGHWTKGSANLTVATFQSIRAGAKRRKAEWAVFRAAIGALFVDEVHAQPADSFYRCTMSFSNAWLRFGGSATPLEKDGCATLRTVGALGPVVHRVEVGTLVALGLLAEPRVKMVGQRHTSEPEWTWRQVYDHCIVRNQARNQLVANMAERAAKPSMLFVDELQHATALLHELRARGLSADVATGSAWKDRRAQLLADLAAGTLDVLICTVIFQEGIDVPELRSVVIASGKSSAVACLQKLGRGMRKMPGKDIFEVWDVRDRSQKWLRQHAAMRIAAYKSRKYRVELFDDLDQATEPNNG